MVDQQETIYALENHRARPWRISLLKTFISEKKRHTVHDTTRLINLVQGVFRRHIFGNQHALNWLLSLFVGSVIIFPNTMVKIKRKRDLACVIKEARAGTLQKKYTLLT